MDKLHIAAHAGGSIHKALADDAADRPRIDRVPPGRKAAQHTAQRELVRLCFLLPLAVGKGDGQRDLLPHVKRVAQPCQHAHLQGDLIVRPGIVARNKGKPAELFGGIIQGPHPGQCHTGGIDDLAAVGHLADRIQVLVLQQFAIQAGVCIIQRGLPAAIVIQALLLRPQLQRLLGNGAHPQQHKGQCQSGQKFMLVLDDLPAPAP